MRVWKEVEGNLGFTNLWLKGSLIDNFKEWFDKRELKNFRAVPYLVIWGIYLARNSSIFEDKQTPPFQVIAQAVALLSSFQPAVKIRRPRRVGELTVDKSIPWSFFDGAYQGLHVLWRVTL